MTNVWRKSLRIPRALYWVLLFMILAGTVLFATTQEELKPEQIIERFSEKESEFARVWQQYTYVQKLIFQVMDSGDRVREQREMEIEVYFTTEGKRETRILSDKGRLTSVQVSPEDISDATSLQPFALTREALSDYKIDYVRKEKVDELETYVFDVEPRKKKRGQRYFQGRIWVDDVDFQIVMTRGKAVPDYRNNKFPEFETVREQIDGEYWFPTWTLADDVLRFGGWSSGYRDVHIRQYILYEDYRKFEVDTSITYEPTEVP